MEDIRILVADVLEKGYVLTLATHDQNGVWASDVIYVHDDQWNIYWLSRRDVRHSQAIRKEGSVAGTITLSAPAEPGVGLQIAGTAEEIEGDAFAMAVRHRLKRKKEPPAKPGDILDAGESWYRLRPEIIELIHEPLFGFEKKITLRTP